MSVGYTLHLSCQGRSCDVTGAFRGDHFFEVQRDAMNAGWRFNAVGDEVWCEGCARMEFPYLFKDTEKRKSSARKVSRR